MKRKSWREVMRDKEQKKGEGSGVENQTKHWEEDESGTKPMEEGKHNTQRGGGTETDSMEMQENIQGEDNISSREEHRMGEAPMLCIP